MLDYYSLINSDDIRTHLIRIGYKFNALEIAWLVYACHKKSYAEKKAYWNSIISTMPDCEVPSRTNCAGWKSLHDFLSRYIEIIDREQKEFYRDIPKGEYVYMYSYLYEGDAGWTDFMKTNMRSSTTARRRQRYRIFISAHNGSINVLNYCFSSFVLGEFFFEWDCDVPALLKPLNSGVSPRFFSSWSCLRSSTNLVRTAGGHSLM